MKKEPEDYSSNDPVGFDHFDFRRYKDVVEKRAREGEEDTDIHPYWVRLPEEEEGNMQANSNIARRFCYCPDAVDGDDGHACNNQSDSEDEESHYDRVDPNDN